MRPTIVALLSPQLPRARWAHVFCRTRCEPLKAQARAGNARFARGSTSVALICTRSLARKFAEFSLCLKDNAGPSPRLSPREWNNVSDPHSYAQQEAAIRAHNQPIVDEFKASLEQAGLSRPTVSHHVSQVALLAEYLISYELKTLDDCTSAHVSWVLKYWYPAKVQRLSMHGQAAQATALKKFFRWMGEVGRLDPTAVKASVAVLTDFPVPKLRRGLNLPSR